MPGQNGLYADILKLFVEKNDPVNFEWSLDLLRSQEDVLQKSVSGYVRLPVYLSRSFYMRF